MRYSSKGKEMAVYALVTNPVVVRFGEEKRQSEADRERGSTGRVEMSEELTQRGQQ